MKELKLAPEDIAHWRAGIKGDKKIYRIYLNDDGEACKIDKRGVPYKVGNDGRQIVPTLRPKHLYSPEDWEKTGAKARAAAYKKSKREKAKAAKKDRGKNVAVGRKAMSKVLDNMICPKSVQCNEIDLQSPDQRQLCR